MDHPHNDELSRRLAVLDEDSQGQQSQRTFGFETQISTNSVTPAATRPSSPRGRRRPALVHNHSTSYFTERVPLLHGSRSHVRMRDTLRYGSSTPVSGRGLLSRTQSFVSTGGSRNHSRGDSLGLRLVDALIDGQSLKGQEMPHERLWYDQFTSTDWVHDSLSDAYRVKALRKRKDVWGKLIMYIDGAQGWILSALVGFVVAVIAYTVDVSEAIVFDLKDGYCARGWYLSEKKCCLDSECEDWRPWSVVLADMPFGDRWTAFLVYLSFALLFALFACRLTLITKTVVPSVYRLPVLDENLAADQGTVDESDSSPRVTDLEGTGTTAKDPRPPPLVYFPAAGSGVAEVRVILSGFVIHGFLGFKTLVIKTLGLILAVASGLSLGKEGPYVHIATCVGNIACRIFQKYDKNDAKRREVLSAAAAAGVAVAFGAPLGGVLFGLEEVAYFFPAKTLFRTFFCCITAALTLKFLNPYGTHKIVMFQVKYNVDWEFFEVGCFVIVGILGGLAGALFIKASKLWARKFRKIQMIKRNPMFEVFLVALFTSLVGYWNPLTKLPVSKLLFNLASPCEAADADRDDVGLCPKSIDDISGILGTLGFAFLVKGFLTIVTFGIKLPAGIYVPSMVVGGLLGRSVGHVVQYIVLRYPSWKIWGSCPQYGEATCIQPGVYGLLAAGATMCGVTRLSVTLAVILFELTGSLDHVLPFSLAILVAKWTADAVEPLSIYDVLTHTNSYPFLDNKHKPLFTETLTAIIPRVRKDRIIDISSSPSVPASSLRRKIDLLHKAGEVDGGLPIVHNGVLVGLIPAPDLEYALDQLGDEDDSECLMTQITRVEEDTEDDPRDFTPYIDPSPVSLDIRSPLDLVYECFAKLGLRYICVLKDGRYAGMCHKKAFVKYVRELEEQQLH